MGLPAVKHLDPVVGVDLHSVLVAPSPTPVFLPHPHVGFMLDLREYVNAALGVIGAIAFTIIEEKAVEYLEDHPDDAKKLEDTAQAVSGELQKLAKDPTVAQALKGAKTAGDIANAVGAGVGMGSIAGRPIFVNGMLRATAGTHAFHAPALHFPLGESFAPPDPDPSNDAEAYMGSKTVLANNDPMAFLALPAMSCWAVGLEPPTHNGAHTKREHLSLPTSFMLPIPTGRPVLVGGPPIVNMAALAKGLFKAFRGSKWAKTLADKLHLKPGFLRCKVLDAEPVDSITGEVIVQQHDFTIAGRLPLVWSRYYASHDTWRGAIGAGWQTPADIRLDLIRHTGDATGVVAYLAEHATAFDTMPDSAGWPARVYDWQYGYALYRRDDRLVMRTRAGIEYEFALPVHRQRAMPMPAENAVSTLPIEKIADLNGNAWVFERGPDGTLRRLLEWTRNGASRRAVRCETDPTGSTRTQTNLLSALILIDADGHAHPLVGYEQDRNGNLVTVLDAMGQPHRFTYGEGHRLLRHTSAAGVSFYYSHRRGDDEVWRVDHAWGDDGLFDYRFDYDIAHHETCITDSRGNQTILQANERGLPVARIDPLGGVTSYRYDARWRTSQSVDPAARATAWQYDPHGNLIAKTRPDGGVVRAAYDSDQRLVSITAPGGRQWRYEWDEFGKLLGQISPAGARSRYVHDEHGQLISHTEPRGATTYFSYDDDSNLIEVIDALGHRTTYAYDARANVTRKINALNQISRYEFDRNGNLTRAIEPGEREILLEYDADGNLTRYRDPNGQVTRMEYAALGQIRRRLAPDGSVVEYRYDSEQQLIGVVNERGELYHLVRDALGRVTEETDYWGQTRRYRYGVAGELLQSIDPLGQTIEYGYDRSGRLVQKRAAGPTGDDHVYIDRFSYDSNGDLVLAQNPFSRVEIRHDADGRVIEERQCDAGQGSAFTIASVYDVAGNRIERATRIVAGNQIVEHVVRYTYDASNAVTSVQIDDAAPTVIARDPLGQARTEHLGADLQRDLSYESSGRLASQVLLTSAGATLLASDYSYDANGELIEKCDALGNSDYFRYDPLGYLTEHLDSFGRLNRLLRDPAGDLLKMRIRERLTAGATNPGSTGIWVREGEYDGQHHEYDRAGNLIRRHNCSQDMTLHWDAAGQLEESVAVRLDVPEASGLPARIRAHYEYDPFQRRVRKITHVESPGGENSISPSQISRFFWDRNTLVGEYTTEARANSHHTAPAPGCAREWVHYPGTFRTLATVYTELMAGKETASTAGSLPRPEMTYFFQNDPNGAPVRMHDRHGKVVWEAFYGPTGSATERGGATAAGQPLRLQGQYFDKESGLHYNRHRYFDPATGSFISQDPIGLEGGRNPYMFAPNPYSWIDPHGTDCKSEFRKWALEKIWAKANHPLRFLLGRDDAGNRIKAFTRPPSRRHEDLIDWANGPTIEAGHVTSKHSGEPELLGLQDAWENQMDNWFGERHGVIVTRNGVIEIGGVPVHTRTAEEWEEYGYLPPGTVAKAPKSSGWSQP
ncbi:RHS repeat-associated core domain-containing protein [Burkholderia sp. Tr-20390]|uniref:RHS repeat-associated core domain-containing protein n=1 Tax=Burkholderia sp. Tr-20390 TaxID=2703904 RepID=UPI001981D432|nr:RHS repeat-associated core domain-containing protein [Burkholderia sp. Tr-20390]MBN3734657.1 type IV secretion protein Rhs [Burkholderia sp. Tr-20390]